MIQHNKPTLGRQEIEAVVNSLNNLELTIGNKVEEFETAFSKYLGINSVATSSGTSALHLALVALGISENDEVILPSYTCITVALPVLYQKAKPILVDVKDDYNISVDDIKSKITDKTKAVIVPHMFGYPADMDEIKEICNEKNVYLIEDCAHSIGAEHGNNKVGIFGDISIFSFYATKMITTIQGGMVCTKNFEINETIKELRDPDQYRSIEDDPDERLKYRYTMSDISGTMGIVQLKKINQFINRRREIAKIYRDTLTNLVNHPLEDNCRKHVYYRYVVRTKQKPKVIIEKMHTHGVDCAMMYTPPLHRRILLKKFNKNINFLKTEEIINSAISLPIYPLLTDEEVLHAADVFNKVVNHTM